MFLRAPRPASAVVVVALALITPGRAGADFIAGNLLSGKASSSGGGFSTVGGFNVTGARTTTSQGYAIAVKFTMGATAMAFDSAELGLAYRAGVNALDLALVADAQGLPLGSTLETIHLAGLFATPTLITAASAVHPTLAAGMSYWLVATPGAPTTDVAWMANITGQVGHSAYRPDPAGATGSWVLGAAYADASFAVLGSGLSTVSTGVPEPSSGLLCGIALVGLIAGHRASRRPAGAGRHRGAPRSPQRSPIAEGKSHALALLFGLTGGRPLRYIVPVRCEAND